MLNQVVVLGRLKEIKEREEGENRVADVTIATPRSFKNADGEYETDFITFVVTGALIENIKEYCNNGDILGVKGRISGDGEKMEIIADKVTFLSSRKEGE